MFIQYLSLQHFRNYERLNIELGAYRRIALIGPNAQGKSNFLEALYVLAFATPFRSAQILNLIQWNQDAALLKMSGVHERGDDFLLGFELRKNGKRLVQVNHTYQQRLADYIGQLKLVLFSQTDLELIKGQPARRRAYLDLLMIQVRPSYCLLLQKYHRIIKQRNSLLKELKKLRNTAERTQKLEQLELWDIQLTQVGVRIVAQRKQVLADLIPLIQQSQAEMSGRLEEVQIDYKTQYTSESPEAFLAALKERHELDMLRGITSVGPHRDELVLKIQQRELKAFGSQGQIRTAALAMKVAELHYVKQVVGEYPLLLLDDVFSELDLQRQQRLIEQISLNNLQTFITTTHLDQAVESLLTDQGRVLHVREGQVREA